MKAFTHGFTDSVSPDNGSNHPFFVNGEWWMEIFWSHLRCDRKSDLISAWAKFYGAEYDVLLVDWNPLALGNSYAVTNVMKTALFLKVLFASIPLVR